MNPNAQLTKVARPSRRSNASTMCAVCRDALAVAILADGRKVCDVCEAECAS